MHSQIVADAYKLYLSFGGLHHREIEAAMRANGYPTFSRRVFYDRKERGKIYPGWIRKFRWNERSSSFTATSQDNHPADEASPPSSPPARGGVDAKRLGWWERKEGSFKDKLSPRPLSSTPTRARSAANKFPSFQRRGAASAAGWLSPPNTRAQIHTARSTRNPNTVSRFTPSSQQKPPSETRMFRRWLKRVSPNMNWSWPHLRYLMRKLSDVTSGKTKRLMIFMPPRHGKSELVTVHYPAYRIKRDPWLNVIVGSYNQKLANRFSRKIRNTFDHATQLEMPSAARIENGKLRMENKQKRVSSPHEPGFPPQHLRAGWQSKGSCSPAVNNENKRQPSSNSQFSTINSPLRSASEWETAMGGGVRAVGVGAGITGYGGKLVIIDDPIKSRSEAESETYRNKTWEWFNDDLYTRLEPDASMILIQTRWHEDDLAGRLLSEMKNGGEHWEVVSLPAICEREQIDNGEVEQIENGQLTMDNEGNRVSSPHEPGSPPQHLRAGWQSKGSCSPVKNKQEERQPPTNSPLVSNSPFSIINSPLPSHSPLSTINSPLSSNSPLSIVSYPLRRTDAIGRLPGDPLCPERFSITELERIRRQLGEYSFSALYQQHPMPLEGGLFKKKWFTRIIDVAPAGLRWFRGYDLAISTKTSADYTASARVAIDNEGFLYIADVFRARVEYPEQRKFIIDRLRNERDTEHCIEDAIHAKAVIHDLRRDPSLARCAIKLVTVTNDKFTRALAWANRAEEGKVILVRGPWINMFLNEVCSFPNAAHDDQVDAVSIAVQSIDRRKRQFFRF